MNIIACQFRLHIPASQSLKMKRSIMKSLVDKLRSEFKISVSEVGDRGHWQIGTLAICYIESSTREDSRIPELIERYIEDKILGKAFLIDVHLDKLTTETE